MCIPVTARHPVDAITYMDYVYRPEIAAMLADYITYITPVPSAKADAAPSIASSPLVFPDAAALASAHRYRVFTDQEKAEFTSIFQPIYQS
jgi:spermidine/putrescine transport system substrate-binding protein